MASNHSSPFAIQLSHRGGGGGGGHDYEEVDQDFEAQDVLRVANNTSNLRSRNNYQRDKHSEDNDISNDYNSSDDDDSEDHESAQRRRRKYMNTSIGDLYQRNNSRHNNNNSSLSFNLILICLLGFLTIFGLGYYALGKREQREMHANEVQEQKELERLKVKYGLVESDKKTVEGDKNANSIQHQVENESAADNSEKKQQHETISSSSKQAQSHLPEHFDPFHLHTNQNQNQQINSHTNDWFGAPFVVSPPQLPSFIASGGDENNDETSSQSGSRLGYFQYPTIFNSTLVFSSEGCLYLTRVPTTTNTDTMTYESMPAMKLTSKVGNAIHPRLNHKYPHLLAYSATYSGDREVYLMDLRSIATSSSIKVPGTPGGPALRLTYTTGGINSVVGWDEDGTSILYSARGDQVGMPDIRLYRLRLSSLGGAVKEASFNSTNGVGDEVSIPKVVHSDDTEQTLGDNSGRKSKNISPVNASKETNQTKNKKKHDNDAKGRGDQKRKLNREQERQRRHAAKLLLSSQSRRGLVGSTIQPILEPVPLSEAVEGVYHTSAASSNTECIYFTRVKQSSSTKRYVGGTAENLWSYCPGEFDDLAIPLTADYNGTSKSPIVYSHGGHGDWLFFLSDRAVDRSGSIGGANQTSGWAASSMDLWAAPLPVTLSGFSSTPTRLTNIACQYGLEVMEYSVDQSNGAVVLRIGADLHYMPMEAIEEKLYPSKKAPGETQIQQLPIAVYSDFSSMQERIIPLWLSKETIFDAYATSYGVSALISSRGQTFVEPVIPDGKLNGNYGGGGLNMPSRRYKVAPGTGGGGMVRILCAKSIPQSKTGNVSDERFALILATDPLSPTGEHAFYIIRTDAMASPSFGFSALYETDTMEETGLPVPFLGGHLESGGSTKDGGLGSIRPETVAVSPCGRRFAYANTDGQLIVATVPINFKGNNRRGRHLASVDMMVLPWENEQSQPLIGHRDTYLVFSPGGRYLAIEHTARNNFKVISIADLGESTVGSLQLGRIVQVTPDRFNSFSVVWGRESKDFAVDEHALKLKPSKTDGASRDGATALFFLSDRDINLEGDTNPWGTRAPTPRFDGHSCVHVLPLRRLKDSIEANEVSAFIQASFAGGGASEVLVEGMKELDLMLKAVDAASSNEDELDDDDIGSSNTTSEEEQPYVMDTPISFEKEKDTSFKFARTSYRLDSIPAGKYVKIVCQLSDDPSLLIVTKTAQKYDGLKLSLFATIDYPSDRINEVSLYDGGIDVVDMSTDGAYVLILVSGELQVVPRTATKFLSFASGKNVAATDGLYVSVWPALEYQQMYADSWRLLRDYFYDAELHQIEWDEVFDRYLPLVERCGNREELDDVMRQMGGELSALHVVVMGGEYDGHASFIENQIASLGATLRRSSEMNGYEIVEIPERDPDFHMRDRQPVSQLLSFLTSAFNRPYNLTSMLLFFNQMYSPLSEQVLHLSGQQALEPGDIIIGVNGEHVMNVPSINMLLRGKAGESVRLEVQRVTSKSKATELRRAKMRLIEGNDDDEDIPATEPLVVVPLSSYERDKLIYAAWEWKTRERAKTLAAESGFTLGYIHLRDMSGAPATNAFARGFYPDHDKQALIVDVRHNAGGNIDSWLLDILQRKAWMYWQGREDTDGGLMWDEQLAFRGHLVVLIDEKTRSDAEIFARGVSELGLGKIVGKRSWGGGIGLAYDNDLVDGGIASAPELGVYNDKFGRGMGIEQMGIVPDVEVDNNPRDAYEGKDTQLEVAISVLKEWLKNEEVVLPKNPGRPKNMSKKRKDFEGCSV
eukprot:scaffold2419_cov126-Skeletonema_dohrnii-CCMP3373.AAC.3